MKPRHVAALALIGWYLIVPPPDGSKTNPRTATLKQWTVFGRYDSAQECSDERSKKIRVQNMALLSDLAEGVSDANRPSLSLDFRHAQCIASDDPRRTSGGALAISFTSAGSDLRDGWRLPPMIQTVSMARSSVGSCLKFAALASPVIGLISPTTTRSPSRLRKNLSVFSLKVSIAIATRNVCGVVLDTIDLAIRYSCACGGFPFRR